MKRLLGCVLAALLSLSVFGCSAKEEPLQELSTPEQRAARDQREREIMRVQQQMAPQMQQQQQAPQQQQQ